MKAFIFIIVAYLTVLVSCNKVFGDSYSSNVDKFVLQLIEGECDSYKGLPRFHSNDVPSLLEYADDFQEINSFPISIASSYLPSRYILGECLLYTIELIKTNEDDFNWNYSLWVPTLVKDSSGTDIESRLLNTDELFEVYSLYKEWWEKNSKDKRFEDFKDINVLENSGYHWLF